MIIVSTDYVANAEVVQTKGFVEGTAFYGVGLWTSICTGFSNVFGKKSKNYAKKMNKMTELAKKNMVEQAQKLGANAIIDCHIVISGLTVTMFGTAVLVEGDKAIEVLATPTSADTTLTVSDGKKQSKVSDAFAVVKAKTVETVEKGKEWWNSRKEKKAGKTKKTAAPSVENAPVVEEKVTPDTGNN